MLALSSVFLGGNVFSVWVKEHQRWERMASESPPAPSVHFPTVLTGFHNHLKKSPSHQEEGITMLKPEEIKCEDVVSEISSTQTSSATLCTNPSPSITHDEEKMASCSETSPAPTVHLPAVLIYFNNHIKKPPNYQEEHTTVLKPEQIKSEDVVSEISSTSSTLGTNPVSRGTHDEEQMGSSSPAPSVQIPAVLIYFQNHSNKPPSHQEECKTVIKPEEIKSEDVVSEISSTQISSATPCINPSPRQTQKNTDKGLIHQCSECERSFTTPSHLQMHQRIHTEEKPYQCLWCEKRFTKPNNLQQHQRIHTGEKPFQCLDCGQNFSRQSHLKRHQHIHTGEKPSHCSECGQSFTCHSDLRRHQRIHARKRPYPCSECGHSFTRQNDLYRHQRFHTEKKHITA
ncbi:zinc finger protein 184-like isoform X1 [Colossoma macropomum]|uniref:zinc finger protein 184-like isoform X1 n=2 Tax=Colossoma macropomum TaxID=42526 RepID=UPI0018650411|nr:zinc finger protein 184-like isoform X1 [Colossoma macropomum]